MSLILPPKNLETVNVVESEHAARFERDGYLYFANWFDMADIGALLAEVPMILGHELPTIRMERQANQVRQFHGAHQISSVFEKLTRHPRVVQLVEDILDGPVYVHNSKVNMKPAFHGSGYGWHQDFWTWYNRDRMPRARAVSVAIFLNDVTIFNGPMYLAPGSQLLGLLPHEDSLVTPKQAGEVVSRCGLYAAIGSRGSVLFLSSLILHASPPNISPFDRPIAFVSYNSIDNTLGDGAAGSLAHFAERNPKRLR